MILVVSTKGAVGLTIETFWRELRILGDCAGDSTRDVSFFLCLALVQFAVDRRRGMCKV